VERRGRALCWFAAEAGYCPVLRAALPLLRREEARRVALALPQDVPATAIAIARETGVPVQTVRSTLAALERAGVARKSVSGRACLREGARICVEKAAAGESCDMWGACAVSAALTRRLDARPAPSRARP